MSDIAIEVEGLGKKYRIGELVPYGTLRDSLSAAATAPYRKLRQALGRRSNGTGKAGGEIWALKDVSFTLRQGEVLGIIGRNGAGKSTLLKILSRITKPTEGRARVRGRIGSLLEVGTGFHPELTGRENIYLNGAILGMKRAEVTRKFDEIVAFAEVERFLDTPVKRYSSGMRVRLAFAVAAHLETEILLVDEVLAVGDAAFQDKCLGKMHSVADEGRTVLFVSHNMGAITSLSTAGLWLDTGTIKELGEIQKLTDLYLRSRSQRRAEADLPPPQRDSDVVITNVFVRDSNHHPSPDIDFRKPFFVGVKFVVVNPVPRLQITVRLKNSHGIPVIFSASGQNGAVHETLGPGAFEAIAELPGHFLVPGRYYVDVGAEVWRVRGYQYVHDCLAFDIVQTGDIDPREPGVALTCPILPWTCRRAAIDS